MEKRTINEQLNIPLLKNAGAETLYMPQLFNEELDSTMGYDYQIVKGGVSSTNSGFSSADGNNGWNNCAGGCGSFSSAEGDCSGITASSGVKGIVACVGGRAVYPPTIWALLKATKNGREKIEYNRCVCLKRKQERKADDVMPSGGIFDDRSVTPTNTTTTSPPTGTSSEGMSGTAESTGMSTGLKIGIGVGAAALIGFGIWFFGFRKKG